MDPASIQAMIENGLAGAQVDVSGADGVHFEATVIASQFAGKLPLARHRLVYATLGDLMGGAILALALKTLTPEEAAVRPWPTTLDEAQTWLYDATTMTWSKP